VRYLPMLALAAQMQEGICRPSCAHVRFGPSFARKRIVSFRPHTDISAHKRSSLPHGIPLRLRRLSTQVPHHCARDPKVGNYDSAKCLNLRDN
jgi:hypothetical protein